MAADNAGLSPGTYSTAGVTLGQAGPLADTSNTSAAVNGTSGTVTVPDATSLRVDRTQPFSVEAWVKTTSTAQQAIASKLTATPTFQGWEFRRTLGRRRRRS